MKAADIRDLTDDQLVDELTKLKREQFNLRFQKASGQLENTTRFRQIRRDVARIRTAMRSRQLEKENGRYRRIKRRPAEPRLRRTISAEADPARSGRERQKQPDRRRSG